MFGNRPDICKRRALDQRADEVRLIAVVEDCPSVSVLRSQKMINHVLFMNINDSETV